MKNSKSRSKSPKKRGRSKEPRNREGKVIPDNPGSMEK